MIDGTGATHPVQILGVYVVDDLAVLSTDAVLRRTFRLGQRAAA